MTTTPSVDPEQLAHHIASMYRDVANETGATCTSTPDARSPKRLVTRPTSSTGYRPRR